MINLKLLDETFTRLRRIAEQNQDTASFDMEMFHDAYEMPRKEGAPRKLIEGDQEFLLRILIPRTDIPDGAVKVKRIDVEERMKQGTEDDFDMEEEE